MLELPSMSDESGEDNEDVPSPSPAAVPSASALSASQQYDDSFLPETPSGVSEMGEASSRTPLAKPSPA
eukprot:8187822-Pyramimonas_sp.AAC.1